MLQLGKCRSPIIGAGLVRADCVTRQAGAHHQDAYLKT
jgi:hypothetical protein